MPKKKAKRIKLKAVAFQDVPLNSQFWIKEGRGNIPCRHLTFIKVQNGFAALFFGMGKVHDYWPFAGADKVLIPVSKEEPDAQNNG